jgi:hypothetical protein
MAMLHRTTTIRSKEQLPQGRGAMAGQCQSEPQDYSMSIRLIMIRLIASGY